MANPQQPELRRSERNEALSPDATEALQGARRPPSTTTEHGPIPESNRAGHHEEHEQDKPDLDAFAERLGIVPEADERAPDDATEASASTEDVGHVRGRRPDAPATTAPRAGRERPTSPERDASARPASGPPGWAVVARAGALVVLEPWIVAGRVAERVRDAIESRLDDDR